MIIYTHIGCYTFHFRVTPRFIHFSILVEATRNTFELGSSSYKIFDLKKFKINLYPY